MKWCTRKQGGIKEWRVNRVTAANGISEMDAAESMRRANVARAEGLNCGRINNMTWEDVLEGFAKVSPAMWFLVGYLIGKALLG